MRYFLMLASFVLLPATFASAQREANKPPPDQNTDPPPKIDPNPNPSDNANGAPNSNGQHQGGAPVVPGALAVGENPQPAPEDDSIDFDHIAEALKDLVKKIADGTAQPTDTVTATTMPVLTAPYNALYCSSALDAFASCSKAYNGTFSAVVATDQAGCLCNAYSADDFNFDMQRCYSYAQTRTQYQSYASVIANATAACTSHCDPGSGGLALNGHDWAGCTAPSATTSTAASVSSTAASGSSSAASVAGTSPSVPSPTTSGAVRGLGVGLGAVMAAVVLNLMAILY